MTDRTLTDFDDLFSRSLTRMGGKIQDVPFPMESDNVQILYKHNPYGYRCEDFNDQEVMMLGCSYTRGDGLPLELTWPYMLSNKMNKPYINLAKGGDGMQAQVIKAFQFFKEFYNPKYIFGVFPLTRLEMPYVKGLFAVNKNPIIMDIDSKYIQNIFISSKKIEKFSKLPHSIDEVMPEEAAIFYNLMFIQMLDQYCKANNIKFIWTIYNDVETEQGHAILNKINLNTFFYEQALDWEDRDASHDLCHLDFSNDQFFYNAADHKKYSDGSYTGHWGFHKHMHLADTMYNLI